MAKFQPTKSRFPQNFAGFWKPKEGDVVSGYISDEFDGEFSKTLLVTLDKPLTVEAKDRDSGALVEVTAKVGESVGINVKAGLRGLDKYVGHTCVIRYLGMKQNGRTSEHVFDTDVSDTKVSAPKPKEGSKSSARA